MGTSPGRIGLLVLVGAASVVSAASYSFTTISVPGLSNTVATGINANLSIVGYGSTSSNVTTGFLASAGQFTTIFVPGSTATMPNGLNDSGQIVGTYTNATGSHGFEYSNGTYTTIDAPGVDSADSLTIEAGTTNLVGISDSGKVAGYATGVYGPFTEACAFTDTAGSFTFYFQGGGTVSIPAGMSASGNFAFSWTGIELPEFLTVDYSSTSSSARFQIPLNSSPGVSGLNDEDQIVIDGSPTSLAPGAPPLEPTGPAISFPGAASTTFLGINNTGWLVGSYVDSSTVTHAFVASPANPTLPDTPEPLIARGSGLCLDVQGGSKQPGAATVQDRCKGSASQQWLPTPVGDGSYELTVQSDGYSLDVSGQSSIPGASVIQWPYWDGANEHWLFQATPDGNYNVVNQHSRLCLDIVGGAGAAAGALTEQNTCNASDSQKWTLPAKNIPTAFTELVVKSSGMCLDIRGQSLTAGTPTIQYACWHGPNQLWEPEPEADGSYQLKAQLTGDVLDVTGQSTTPGASVIQWPSWNGPNERWYFELTPDGYYTLLNQNSGLCLDIVGGAAASEGALTEQNTCNGTDSQKWSLVAP